LNNLGAMLSALGRREEALAPSQEAVAIYRRLAEANPAAYLPDLARGLWGFASVRVAVGLELEAALAAVEESIELYQRLAEQLPAVFIRDWFSACGTFADVLDGLGRGDEASAVRRQLAELSSGRAEDRMAE
jgi:tetratricopeptide (TPR) repeat protein